MRFRTSRSRRPGAAGLLGGRGGSLKMRLLIGAAIALFAIGSWYFSGGVNPVTGEHQRTGDLNAAAQVQMGLATAPEMADQFGGVAQDPRKQQLVQEVGHRLVAAIPSVYPDAEQIPWEFSFTLLEDDRTVNAFALPGGPTFMTEALFDRLETEDEVAGVMGHEIGHVLHQHGAERMAKQEMFQGLSGAAVMAAGDYTAGQVTGLVTNFIGMKYGREDEIESDVEGVRLMHAAGYDPRALIRVMEVLEEASGGAGGPEWASSHPDPGNRAELIREEIDKLGLGADAGLR